MEDHGPSSNVPHTLPTHTASVSGGDRASMSNLALSMYSSATNNNTNNLIVPVGSQDTYLVAINNEAEVEYAGIDDMFYAIFENDGTPSQRTDMKEKIRTKCNEEFKTISLHVILKNSAEIRATVRSKGASNLVFYNSEDAREYVSRLDESMKEHMVVETLKVRFYIYCLLKLLTYIFKCYSNFLLCCFAHNV
jgi:hypothetical protein